MNHSGDGDVVDVVALCDREEIVLGTRSNLITPRFVRAASKFVSSHVSPPIIASFAATARRYANTNDRELSIIWNRNVRLRAYAGALTAGFAAKWCSYPRDNTSPATSSLARITVLRGLASPG